MRGISLIRLNPRRCTNRKQALNSSPIHMRYILGMPGRCVDDYLFIYLFIYIAMATWLFSISRATKRITTTQPKLRLDLIDAVCWNLRAFDANRLRAVPSLSGRERHHQRRRAEAGGEEKRERKNCFCFSRFSSPTVFARRRW